MKKLSAIICLLGITLYASANAMDAQQTASFVVPIKSVCNTRTYTSQKALSLVTPMTSVNNTTFMTAGSRFKSAVYEIGSGSASNNQVGPRKAPPTIEDGTTTTDNFNNPQYGPVGDAIIPLLLLALGYGVVLYNKRKAKDLSLCD